MLYNICYITLEDLLYTCIYYVLTIHHGMIYDFTTITASDYGPILTVLFHSNMCVYHIILLYLLLYYSISLQYSMLNNHIM